jgi:putative toxin-antitoxin system antitoxin component (TIGR02293 family)
MCAMAIYSDEIKRVRALGIDTADIARATGAARATVTAWLRATRRPRAEHRERLLELVAIADRLSDVMDDDQIALWLQKPLRALDDQRPLDAIAMGDYRAVSRLVAELENDSFS